MNKEEFELLMSIHVTLETVLSVLRGIEERMGPQVVENFQLFKDDES